VAITINKAQSFSEISLNGIGKKFRSQWIFKNINTVFSKGDRIAVSGPNGSGKSTLLQLIAGYITPSEGTMQWKSESTTIASDQLFRHLTMAAPYMELIEEFTLEENINFFLQHKKFREQLNSSQFIEKIELSAASSKPVKYFSSGMKQRMKLGMAILAQTDVLFLDEPLSNLDKQGYDWYRKLIETIPSETIVFVGSNMVKDEAFFCNREMHIQDFK
jgi:ABC-type multidrug transport system ATPase subunit